jgi:hypothetical protein
MPKEDGALDQDLGGRGLLREKRHGFVDEGVQGEIAGARRLTGGELGLHRRRNELDHLDRALQLLAQRQSVGVDGGLGRRISGRGRQRHEAEARGHGDDRGAGLPDEAADQGLRQPDHAQEVGRNHLFRIGGRAALPKPLEPHDARAMDQHVDVGMLCGEVFDEPGDRPWRRDVERDRGHAIAPAYRFVQRIQAAPGDDHRIAERLKAPRQLATDAGAAAGDQDRIVRDLHRSLLQRWPVPRPSRSAMQIEVAFSVRNDR